MTGAFSVSPGEGQCLLMQGVPPVPGLLLPAPLILSPGAPGRFLCLHPSLAPTDLSPLLSTPSSGMITDSIY